MKEKLGLLLLCIVFSTGISAQKTTFYKDANLSKTTTEKKAKFKKAEFYKGDTLMIQTRKVSNEALLSESKWINDKAVGVWRKFDPNGKLTYIKDFGILVYSNRPLPGMYDNANESEDYVAASYPTGEPGMFQYLGTSIRYPAESKELGHSGVVYIRFTIDKEGNVEPYSIGRGVDPFIDIHAWELIEKMPKWNPATKNGEPVESYFNLPIRFSLR